MPLRGGGQRAAARAGATRAEREQRAAARQLEKTIKERQRLSTTPREIYVRDTTRESKTEVIYEISDNPRSPESCARLRAACVEASRRTLRANGRRLRFEVVPGGGGSTP